MNLEWLKIEESWNWEKIEKTQAEQKLESLSQIQSQLDNSTYASNPEIKDKLEKNPNLKNEISQFIEDSANNKLNTWLDKFNSQKFDSDNETGLDQIEFSKFEEAINWAIEQIIKLDWMKDFQETYDDATDEWWITSPDKWLANKLLIWEKDFKELTWWNSFTEEWLKQLGLTEQNLEDMRNKPFDITSAQSIKELGILVWKELWEGVESIIKLLLNIPAAAVLLPRYLNYRVDINWFNDKDIEIGKIKINELTQNNPALAMLDLAWEKWLEMIKKLWEMISSWKQGDIATILVSLAWLIAWWAWLLKTWTKFARKEAVMNARQAWREARIAAWADEARNLRNTARDVANNAWKTQEKFQKIDDVLSWSALIWKIWGAAVNDEVFKADKLTWNDNLYFSNFSNNVPNSLKSENPVAWINKDWSISFNQSKLEQQFWVKITWEKWQTTFDWLSLKDFIKQNPEKWNAIMETLKNYKWHEATHRVLELNWIERVDVKINWQTRIFWQEEIAHIVDGSQKVSPDELQALEKILQEKVWPDFKLNSDKIRRTDTQNLNKNEADWFKRESEAAKSWVEITKSNDQLLQSNQKLTDDIYSTIYALAEWELTKTNQLFHEIFNQSREDISNKIFWAFLEQNGEKLTAMENKLNDVLTQKKAELNQKRLSQDEALKDLQKVEQIGRISKIETFDQLVDFCKKEIPELENYSKEQINNMLQNQLTDNHINTLNNRYPWFKDSLWRAKENKLNLETQKIQEAELYRKNEQFKRDMDNKYDYFNTDNYLLMNDRIKLTEQKITDLKNTQNANPDEIKYLENLHSNLEKKYMKLDSHIRRHYEEQFNQLQREQKRNEDLNRYANQQAQKNDANRNAMWNNNSWNTQISDTSKPAWYHIDEKNWIVRIHATPEERAERYRRQATNWKSPSNW